ncbi:MAG: hypothetical protein L0215_16715 [Gemmataceae bacterium]|nr:hypothetical protein [Gemmataceae bacterium]
MLAAFFSLAAVSPARQGSFRLLAAAHVGVVGCAMAASFLADHWRKPVLLGQVLLIAGIVEGGLLVGWRLTQLPKSQALEFLLVSPLRPSLVFLSEAAVGLARLALVTLAGLPFLALLLYHGALYPEDLPALLLVPWIWGAVTGLCLTQYAYEPPGMRRWFERFFLASVLFYLIVGVLAAEHLPRWLSLLPAPAASALSDAFRGFHENNPFAVMQFAMQHAPAWAWPKVLFVFVVGFVWATAALIRAALRLHGHFHDEHYRPAWEGQSRHRPQVGDRPLTWWAIKRVTKFSGRINLWLAGGFGVLYAVFTVFENDWPDWLGRSVFDIFERMGGIPALATGLVLLSAVPAAFQYGVWDSNTHDRSRRLELLLLTHIDGRCYWHASFSAAWKRGRGYFLIALVLWLAAWWAEKATLAQVLAGMSAGAILWAFYFALGFRAFARGMHANLLGLALSIGIPLATVHLCQHGLDDWAALLPPGGVFLAVTRDYSLALFLGSVLAGFATLWLVRRGLTRCESELRRWYSENHGLKAQ